MPVQQKISETGEGHGHPWVLFLPSLSLVSPSRNSCECRIKWSTGTARPSVNICYRLVEGRSEQPHFRCEETKVASAGHTAGTWQRWDGTPGLSQPFVGRDASRSRK